MSYSAEDVERMMKDMQRDLTGIKTRLSDLQRALASFNLPEKQQRPRCPHPGCGLEIRGKTMAEHLEDVHGVGQP